jgi:hypothetical protein
MTTSEDIFRCQVANLREVKRAVRAVERPIKLAIREADEGREEVLTKLYMLLVAAKLECRLQKLVYQPDGFSASQRAEILSAGSQLDQWLAAVDVGFRFQYRVRTVSSHSIGFTAAAQHDELGVLIRVELRPLIELRNKLAHGQWAYALTNDGTDIAQDQMRDMKTLNYTNIRMKSALADYICDAIHELVVARDAKNRNFDQHYNRVLESRRNLATADHRNWSSQLRALHLHTRRHRSGN